MADIPHDWNLPPQEAVALQKRLASYVDAQTPLEIDSLRTVAGVDVSVKNGISRAAVVVMAFPSLEIIETATAAVPTPFPYISGLLSFREGAVILQAIEQITQKPDVYLFDGQGLIHPRRLGIACHIGLWLDAPTIGIGKTHYIGEYDQPSEEKGEFSEIVHRDEVIGVLLRTRAQVKPVYVSVGHRATLDTARQLALRCSTRYRLPEPIRAAHISAGDF